MADWVSLSDALIHPSQERLGTLKRLPPLRVVAGGWLGCDHLGQSPALFLELGDFLARIDQHIAKQREVRLPRDCAMAWNHNRGCADFRKVCFRCANLAIDAASGRVVDKRIVAIPERVSCVQNISFGKVYGYVRIGM